MLTEVLAETVGPDDCSWRTAWSPMVVGSRELLLGLPTQSAAQRDHGVQKPRLTLCAQWPRVRFFSDYGRLRSSASGVASGIRGLLQSFAGSRTGVSERRAVNRGTSPEPLLLLIPITFVRRIECGCAMRKS